MPHFPLIAYLQGSYNTGLQDLGCGRAASKENSHFETKGIKEELQSLPETWVWWTCRALTLQQRILSGPSSSLRFVLEELMPLV